MNRQRKSTVSPFVLVRLCFKIKEIIVGQLRRGLNAIGNFCFNAFYASIWVPISTEGGLCDQQGSQRNRGGKRLFSTPISLALWFPKKAPAIYNYVAPGVRKVGNGPMRWSRDIISAVEKPG